MCADPTRSSAKWLPPARAAAPLPESGPVSLRPVGGSEDHSGEGLPLLVPSGLRTRKTRGVTVVRPQTLGHKQGPQYTTFWPRINLQAGRKTVGRLGKLPHKLFAGFSNLTVRNSVRVALVYLSFVCIRSCESGTPAKRFRERNHFFLFSKSMNIRLQV